MNDPEPQRNGTEDERRRREEEMERLMLEQEEEEERQLQEEQDGEDDPVDQDGDPLIPPIGGGQHAQTPNPKKFQISYLQASFMAAVGLVWYALRTRQQWYLALVFLGSSKWANAVLGNALVAFCVMIFRSVTNFFLGGLRLLESERLGDFFRWNVTETCLALTMFRSELTIQSCIFFLFLVLGKCLHRVAELREGHLRMTQETFVPRASGIFKFLPKIQQGHCGVFLMLQCLMVVDLLVVIYCIQEVVGNGLSVQILFGFEAGIMTVSAISSLFLWNIHAIDSFLQYLHDDTSVEVASILHGWKDRKATIMFAIEVQAQGAKFLLYCTFFAIVLTYHALPINLFRELYMSFQALKQRLLAFAKYRRLMASMNQFANVESEEELEEAGITCIICRDEMSLRDCKRLPGCGHCFHKSCLREWLVQQQTCPTCRADITVNAARERRRAAQEAAAAAQQEQEQNIAHQGQDETRPPEQTRGHDALRVGLSDEMAEEDASNTSPAQSARTVVSSASESIPRSRGQRHVILRVPPLLPKTVASVEPTSGPRNPRSSSLLPAIYLVTSEEGTAVYDLENGETLRTIPKDVAVFGTGLDLKNFKDNLGLMLKIPDGWIWESDVKLVSSCT